MNQFFRRIIEKIKNNKLLSAGILLAALIAGYFGYQNFFNSPAGARYVLAAVQKGTLIISTSGTGQVSASNQVDIKTKTSGEVTSVLVAQGQEVKAGAALLYIDARDAQKAVRDAQANLESAQLALEKLLAPVDQLTLMQAEDAVNQAKQAKQDAQDSLEDLSDDEFNTISSSFLELPSIMAGLDNILFGRTINSNQSNLDYYLDMIKIYDERSFQYRASAYNSYIKARAAYDKNFIDYKAVSRYSDANTIETLLNETYETEKSISDAIKNANNLIQFYQDTLTKYTEQNPVAMSDTHLSGLSSYTGKVNSHLTSLSALRQEIISYEKTISDSDRTIEEKQLSLEKTQEGAEATEIKTQQLAVEGKENALIDAKQNLADCTLRAPFDGVVASIDLKKGDSASSGAAAVTFITKQRIAEITLNEVDIAKVKVGQKTTLTFDAIDELSITGEVAEVDIIGAASQGVVSYGVKISFDTQDERVKPGMSIAASIITEVKTDVLLVPGSAVKSSGGRSYVQVLDGISLTAEQIAASTSGITSENSPRQQTVQVGATNDSYVEIVSGLSEGDLIISKTITAATSQATTQKNGGGGNGFMMLR